MRRQRFEREGPEKHREVNNIKKWEGNKTKQNKNWIGEQCSEFEENLRKSNCRKSYQIVKDLTTVKHGKGTTTQDHLGKRLAEE